MKTCVTQGLLMAVAAAGLLAGDASNRARADQAGQAGPKVVAMVAPAVQTLSLDDVKAMIKARMADEAIIYEINRTQSAFFLDADAIIHLQFAGASERVMDCMINSTTNLVFSQGPPPAPADAAVAPPGPDFVWIPGQWELQNGGWVWIEGGWVVPPDPNMVWTEPRWEDRADGWHYVPGYWR